MLGTVRSNVKHVIGVAVVGGNQRKAALGENRRDNLGQGIVNSLDGLNGSVEDTGVTNHVAVCEVHDVEISAILVDGGDKLLGNLGSAHLRLQVVGSDLGRSDEHALLALLGLLDAAVEEERHVGVLLGLGGVQLLQAIGGDNVGQDVLGERLGEGDLDVKRRVVLGHRHKVRKLDLLALKAVELLVREHASHLTSAVGTEVEEDGRVALVDALVVGSEGLDELVAARILLVVGLDTGNGVDIGIGRIDHDVVGALDALPTVIAVHGPITARHGGNASVATGLLGDLRQEGAELTHVASAGLRVDVAAIHEGVDANGLDTVLGSHLDQSLDVAHMRMNTARAHKAHEVESLAVSLDVVHSLDEDLVLGDGAVLDGIVDARKLLEHDAAGTDVEVTHLGVAHLAIGKTHVLARSAERGVGVLLVQAIEEGRLGSGDGVLAIGRSQAATIHDDQECRKMTLCHMSYSPALTTIEAKSAALSEAPPTRAPSTSGLATSSAMLPGLAEPPYRTRMPSASSSPNISLRVSRIAPQTS